MSFYDKKECDRCGYRFDEEDLDSVDVDETSMSVCRNCEEEVREALLG